MGGMWPGDLRNDLARGFLQFGSLNMRTAKGLTRPAKIVFLKKRSRGKKVVPSKGAACFGKSSQKLKRPEGAACSGKSSQKLKRPEGKCVQHKRGSSRTTKSGKKTKVKGFAERTWQLPWSKKHGWVC